MKFIHWTDERNIRRIRHTGIRTHRYYFGKGVCCVPIIGPSPSVIAGPTKNGDGDVANNKALWRWLVSQRPGSKRAAAVIFELSHQDIDDIRIHLSVFPNTPARRMVETLLSEDAIVVDQGELQAIRRYNRKGIGSEATLGIRRFDAITRLGACFTSNLWQEGFYDDFEVLIERPIRPREIVKVEMRHPKGHRKRPVAKGFDH